jgi:hypothetical protein
MDNQSSDMRMSSESAPPAYENPTTPYTYPNGNPAVDQDQSKNSLGINNVKFKELVSKSYTQTLLYLNLTIKIITEQLKNNSGDDSLITLQNQCQSAIKIMEIGDDLKKTLGIDKTVNAITDESSITIAELLLEIAGLGVAVTAGGKRSRSKGKSKRRRTTRRRN